MVKFYYIYINLLRKKLNNLFITITMEEKFKLGGRGGVQDEDDMLTVGGGTCLCNT